MEQQVDYEKLGIFYLGREIDPEKNETTPYPLLYKNKNLTTHAAIIGMTGSGKTGLGVGLIEEAVLDNIPAIVIDPKGDMGNLLLSFPELRPKDFEPWVDPASAARKEMSITQYAEDVAATWKGGLKKWNQDGGRIKTYAERAERTIYTPGSSAGVQVSLLSGFQVPPDDILADSDTLNSVVNSFVTGLLALIGKNTEPLKSKEHLLISCILLHCWKQGEDLSMESLIGYIVSPPFTKIGVFGLDTFYVQAERMKQAMELNNILASPQYAAWLSGEPLDIQRFLYTKTGKPRVAIFSIAHLSEPERMFFTTLLLNAVLGWMRRQQGTSSLKALLYMDEIHGYFPPSANPPSKKPMMLLLKQARAFGVGVVLATQNPVDLDYKGLSNNGTWFIGRLQTRQDQDRIMDGLTGTGDTFEKAELRKLLAALQSRRFLLRSIHLDAPVLFETRWALSYLKGPITRDDIKRLTTVKGEQRPLAESRDAAPATLSAGVSHPPILSNRIEQLFYCPPIAAETFQLQPCLCTTGSTRFYNAKRGIDQVEDCSLRILLDRDTRTISWDLGEPLPFAIRELSDQPPAGARYLSLPELIGNQKNFKQLSKEFSDYLYQTKRLELYRVRSLKLESLPDESLVDFQVRIGDQLRERKDTVIDKLEDKFRRKQQTLEDRLLRAQDRLEKEQRDVSASKVDTALSFGVAILGSLFGRSKFSLGTAGKAATGVRKAGKMMKEKDDVEQAGKVIERLQEDLDQLNQELNNEIEELTLKFAPEHFEIETFSIKPRRADIFDVKCVLLWEAVPDLQTIE